MRPFDAKDDYQASALRRSCFDREKYWIMTDGFRVTITEQKVGQAATQSITIPRTEFNRLATWYMRDQPEK